jgi:hypothetical protein
VPFEWKCHVGGRGHGNLVHVIVMGTHVDYVTFRPLFSNVQSAKGLV